MVPKRKATNDDTNTRPMKQIKGPAGAVSTLIPVGPRVRAVKGRRDESMLHMLCDDLKNPGKQKELHFKKLVHSQIDWDSAEDIAKINSWRNQLYGRAGMKAKTVVMWHEDEEAFLELYFHILIAEGMIHGLMLPKAKDILEAFNRFFVGKVLTDNNGNECEPREPRKHNAFVSKMTRIIALLKERLEDMLIGKTGDVFHPQISDQLLRQYIAMKKELDKEDRLEELLEPQLDVINDAKYIKHLATLVPGLVDIIDPKKLDDTTQTSFLNGDDQASPLSSPAPYSSDEDVKPAISTFYREDAIAVLDLLESDADATLVGEEVDIVKCEYQEAHAASARTDVACVDDGLSVDDEQDGKFSDSDAANATMTGVNNDALQAATTLLSLSQNSTPEKAYAVDSVVDEKDGKALQFEHVTNNPDNQEAASTLVALSQDTSPSSKSIQARMLDRKVPVSKPDVM